MLPVSTVKPKYIHTVDIFDLPEEYQQFIRDISQRNEYRILNYSDGDYFYVADLSLAKKDQTSEDVLEAFLEERAAPSTYPFAEWRKEAPHEAKLFEYVTWLKLVRYMVANLPEDVVATNSLAIDIWH